MRAAVVEGGVAAEDVEGGGQGVGFGSGWGGDGGGECSFGGAASARIEDVAVAAAFVEEELGAAAGSAEGAILQVDFADAAFGVERMAEADGPGGGGRV